MGSIVSARDWQLRAGGAKLAGPGGTRGAAMTAISAQQADLDVLAGIKQRVLWLATRIVDTANHDRDTGDGVKVGGHQASSASLVSVMTALYFAYLDGPDKVSVKPHASPGVPRHPVPARRAGPRATCRRCARSAACRPTRAAPRTRTARLLHRLGRPGRGRTAVRRGDPPLRGRALRPAAAPPVRGADRRRRAGRGQHLGSGRRPRHRRARQRDVDRGPEPADAGPGGARGPDRPVGAAVHRGGLARGGGQVRRGAAGGLRPARRRTRCGTGSTTCPTSTTRRSSAWPGRVPGPVPGRRAGRRERFCADMPDDELAALVTDLGGHDLR